MPAIGMGSTQVERRTMATVGWAGLNVTMTLPHGARAVVVVPDGSGDNICTAGDLQVARTLLDDGFGVVEVRLLARREAALDAETSALRFDAGLLAGRLSEVVAWVADQPSCRDLRIGVFATGTCGAAALRAAARGPDLIDAVVCRAPRPELVTELLGRLCAETLLLLGSTDVAHLEESRSAQRIAPPGVIELDVIAGGRPMLDTPAERDVVARRTSEWFARTIGSESPRPMREILSASARSADSVTAFPWGLP